MILHTVEFGFLDVLVEKRYGLCFKVAILILLFRLLGVQFPEESITLLVEFQRCFWVDNFIIELKFIIYKILEDINFGVKINWSLHSAQHFALK